MQITDYLYWASLVLLKHFHTALNLDLYFSSVELRQCFFYHKHTDTNESIKGGAGLSVLTKGT